MPRSRDGCRAPGSKSPEPMGPSSARKQVADSWAVMLWGADAGNQLVHKVRSHSPRALELLSPALGIEEV